MDSAQRIEQLGRGFGAKVAKITKTTRGHVSQVLNGKRFDAQIVDIAARKLGLDPTVAFPEYPQAKRQSSQTHRRA